MLGCEIIEAAEQGELILWKRKYAERMILAHVGASGLSEFEAEIQPAWEGGKIAAATVLLWLGY
jgi:hypothetical protein